MRQAHSLLLHLPLLIEAAMALLTLCGLVYSVVALLGARAFVRHLLRSQPTASSPGFSVLKPVRGTDPEMYAAFAGHCVQQYGGEFEILFGVGSLEDPAVDVIHQLQAAFPNVAIRLIECPEQLGANAKVSTLIQLARHAQYPYFIINDSDILVSPHYFERIAAAFSSPSATSRPIGMVTALYRANCAQNASDRATLGSRIEALGISTDFIPGVLAARLLEGGIHFGLGSTLALSPSALQAIGGLDWLADYLADDYQLGARISAAGFKIAIASEVVSTTVPAYNWQGFFAHQLRWARSTRDSRRWGYVGMGVTFALPWALFTVLASGGALWSLALLVLVVVVRVAVALSIGVGLLGDSQALRDLWLLPLRDSIALAIWLWSFAGDTVIWRGQKFTLRKGRLVAGSR